MTTSTDKAIERFIEWLGEGWYSEPKLRKHLESLVVAGWRERKGPPPY